MALIKPYKGHFPSLAPGVFVAENATLIGEVYLEEEANIWYGAVLRGDVGSIRVGPRSSIQDLVMIHATLNRSKTTIGAGVIVGHGAILHGCTIEDEVLIGMGATILDNAMIPSHTLIAANALVPENKILESGYLYAGVPARKIKPLTKVQIDNIIQSAGRYVEYAEEHESAGK